MASPGIQMSRRSAFRPRSLLLPGLSCLLLALLAVPCRAGETERLEAALETATGIERIDTLNKLSARNYRKAPEKSLAYATEALESATQAGYERGRAIALGHIGTYHFLTSEHDRALERLTQAMKIQQELGERADATLTLNRMGLVQRELGDLDASFSSFRQALQTAIELDNKKSIASNYSSLGANFRLLGDFDTALEHYLLSLEIRQELDDQAGVARAQHNVGLVYKLLGHYDKAMEHLSRSLEHKRTIGDKRGASKTLNVIGNIEKDRGNHDAAMAHLQEALALQTELGYRDGIGSTHNNIGQLYRKLGDLTQAAEHYRTALEQFESSGKKRSLANTSNNLGVTLLGLGRHALAAEHLGRAGRLAEELGALDLLRDNLSHRSELQAARGDYAEAYRLQQEARAQHDRIFSAENSARVAEMQARYETQKKETEIRILQSESALREAKLEQARTTGLLLATGIAILLLGSIVIGVLYRNQARAKNQLSDKNDELQTALREIDTLHGILPICMYCKKIRDDREQWLQLERYISTHSKADFSHSICPDCLDASGTSAQQQAPPEPPAARSRRPTTSRRRAVDRSPRDRTS